MATESSRECAKLWAGKSQVLEMPPVVPVTTRVKLADSPVSLKMLAAALVLVFLYYAQGVVITLVLAILLAYFLDPAVVFLESLHLARGLAAMVMVLLLILILGLAGYGLATRTADFAANWPTYSGVIKQAANNIEGKLNGIEKQVSPDSETTAPPPKRSDEGVVRAALYSGIGSLYGLVLEVTFVPFLVFFMLAGKREVWHGTLQLFPVSKRTQVKETLEDLRDVLRDYLAGMSIVTLVVVAISSLFFMIMGLDYPVLTGIVSGLLNMVPYIGAVLAWLPPFLLGLAKWKTVSPYLITAGVLTGIHMFAQNLCAPQVDGQKVRLNAVAITVSLLFWGWLWGGMGLVLAIPLTAALRVICDHNESWKAVGRWLSA